MKRNIIVIVIIMAFVGTNVQNRLFAQECGTDCFYLVTKTVFNPGYHMAEAVDRLRIRKRPDYIGFVRHQRALLNANVAYDLSMIGGNYRFSNNGAVGVHLLSENQGIFSYVDIEANYSTVAKFSRYWKGAITMSTGIFRQDINKSLLVDRFLNDPLIFQNSAKYNGFKMGGGFVVMYKKKYAFSIYSPYIVKPRHEAFSNIGTILSANFKHQNFKIGPSFMYYYYNKVEDSYRLAVEVNYKDRVTFVPSYEANGDFSFGLVFNVKNTRVIFQYKIGTPRFGGASFFAGGDIVGDSERLVEKNNSKRRN